MTAVDLLVLLVCVLLSGVPVPVAILIASVRR